MRLTPGRCRSAPWRTRAPRRAVRASRKGRQFCRRAAPNKYSCTPPNESRCTWSNFRFLLPPIFGAFRREFKLVSLEIQIFWPRFYDRGSYACKISSSDIFSNRPSCDLQKLLQKTIISRQTLTIIMCADDEHFGPFPANAVREKAKKPRRPRVPNVVLLVVIEGHLSTDERVRREGEETPPVDAGEATWAFETRSGERPPRSPRRRPRSRGRANHAAESEPEPPCWRCEAGASPRTESSRERARTDRIPGRSPPPLTVSTPNVCADRLGDA